MAAPPLLGETVLLPFPAAELASSIERETKPSPHPCPSWPPALMRRRSSNAVGLQPVVCSAMQHTQNRPSRLPHTRKERLSLATVVTRGRPQKFGGSYGSSMGGAEQMADDFWVYSAPNGACTVHRATCAHCRASFPIRIAASRATTAWPCGVWHGCAALAARSTATGGLSR
jgi:hypothetical protein